MLPSNLSRCIEVTSGCWKWKSYVDSHGYGRFDIQRNSVRYRNYAHREVYQHIVGDIPVGMELDHLCKVRDCVNPKHLEVVTPRENSRRSNSVCAVNSRKTHCKRGHEFTQENIYKMKFGRACRICRKAATDKANAQIKELRRIKREATKTS